MPSGSDELGSTYVRSEPHATRRAAKEAVSRPDRYPAVESHLPNRLKGIAIVTIFAGELICVGPGAQFLQFDLFAHIEKHYGQHRALKRNVCHRSSELEQKLGKTYHRDTE